MSAADQLAEKASRVLPAGYKALAQFQMPWQDEDGVWHEPFPDNIVLRIRHDPIGDGCRCVDGIVHESEASMSEQDLLERIIKPMLAVLEQHK